MKTTLAPTVLLLAIIGAPYGKVVAKETSFTPLGDLSGSTFDSFAFDVSANGMVVVGASFSENGILPYHWTSREGMVSLGDLPGGDSSGIARAVSANGKVIVGGSQSENGGEAFRWTPDEGMVGLGGLPGGLPGGPPANFLSEARDVSANGKVVVGESQSENGFEAFRWTTSEGTVHRTPRQGMVGLGDLPGGAFQSGARAVSANGNVIVGQGRSDNGFEAFRWTTSEGMVGLGDLPGGGFTSGATDVSANGNVVVGSGSSDNGQFEAFRWTPGGGMVGLGDLPGGGFTSSAEGVSANGNVVVGTSETERGLEAFVWSQATEMLSVQEWLSSASVDLAGWQLTRATSVTITANGKTIVGRGINPDGNNEAWLATFSNSSGVPEPSGLATMLTLGAALVFTRRPGGCGT